MIETKKEREEAKAELRRLLTPSDTIYVIQRSVSRSGMTRYLDLYYLRGNEPHRITWSVAQALGWTYNRGHEALVVKGCGMDMHFHTVYSLSITLFYNKEENNIGISGYYLKHRTL